MLTRLAKAIAKYGLVGLPQAAMLSLRARKRSRERSKLVSVFTQAERAALTAEARAVVELVECPLCGYVGQAFCPIEGSYGLLRFNALCPNCGALERHRLAKLVLDDLSAQQWEGRLLHFAPEAHLGALLRQIDGVDYLSGDLQHANVDCWLDIQALPFADGSFDYIFCSHVLEHVPDDRRAVAELRRVLRPGGTALVCVPHDPDAYDTANFSAPNPFLHGHLHHYGRDFVERVRESFDVEDCSTDSRSAAEALRHGLCRSDMLLVCR